MLAHLFTYDARKGHFRLLFFFTFFCLNLCLINRIFLSLSLSFFRFSLFTLLSFFFLTFWLFALFLCCLLTISNCFKSLPLLHELINYGLFLSRFLDGGIVRLRHGHECLVFADQLRLLLLLRFFGGARRGERCRNI